MPLELPWMLQGLANWYEPNCCSYQRESKASTLSGADTGQWLYADKTARSKIEGACDQLALEIAFRKSNLNELTPTVSPTTELQQARDELDQHHAELQQTRDKLDNEIEQRTEEQRRMACAQEFCSEELEEQELWAEKREATLEKVLMEAREQVATHRIGIRCKTSEAGVANLEATEYRRRVAVLETEVCAIHEVLDLATAENDRLMGVTAELREEACLLRAKLDDARDEKDHGDGSNCPLTSSPSDAALIRRYESLTGTLTTSPSPEKQAGQQCVQSECIQSGNAGVPDRVTRVAAELQRVMAELSVPSTITTVQSKKLNSSNLCLGPDNLDQTTVPVDVKRPRRRGGAPLRERPCVNHAPAAVCAD